MLQDGVSEPEVVIAKKQVRAQLAYASEGVTNQGYWLGSLETVDSYKTFDSLLDRVRGGPSRRRAQGSTVLPHPRQAHGRLVHSDHRRIGRGRRYNAGSGPPQPLPSQILQRRRQSQGGRSTERQASGSG